MGNTEVVVKLRGLLTKIKEAVDEGDELNKDIDLHSAVLEASEYEFDDIRGQLQTSLEELEQIIEDVNGD